jgi:hypothetical protein
MVDCAIYCDIDVAIACRYVRVLLVVLPDQPELGDSATISKRGRAAIAIPLWWVDWRQEPAITVPDGGIFTFSEPWVRVFDTAGRHFDRVVPTIRRA